MTMDIPKQRINHLRMTAAKKVYERLHPSANSFLRAVFLLEIRPEVYGPTGWRASAATKHKEEV